MAGGIDCQCGICAESWYDDGNEYETPYDGPCPNCGAQMVWLPKEEAARVLHYRSRAKILAPVPDPVRVKGPVTERAINNSRWTCAGRKLYRDAD